jgi:hypothetical protein
VSAARRARRRGGARGRARARGGSPAGAAPRPGRRAGHAGAPARATRGPHAAVAPVGPRRAGLRGPRPPAPPAAPAARAQWSTAGPPRGGPPLSTPPPPPGPFAPPLLGNIVAIKKAGGLHYYMDECRRRYGRVFKVCRGSGAGLPDGGPSICRGRVAAAAPRVARRHPPRRPLSTSPLSPDPSTPGSPAPAPPLNPRPQIYLGSKMFLICADPERSRKVLYKVRPAAGQKGLRDPGRDAAAAQPHSRPSHEAAGPSPGQPAPGTLH